MIGKCSLTTLLALICAMSFASDPVAGQCAEDESLLVQGQRMLEQGDFEAAVELFTSAIEENPNSAEAYEGRSIAYKELANSVDDQGERDRAYLRHLSDHDKAVELEFQVAEVPELLEEARRKNKEVASWLILSVVFYFGGWSLVAFLWHYKGASPTIPGVVFIASVLNRGIIPGASFLALVLLIVWGRDNAVGEKAPRP